LINKINIYILDDRITSANTYYAIFDPRMPDLNYDCERVQDEICRIGRTWLELGVDGFRLDAAKYFYKPPRLKSNLAWWTKFRSEMSRINPSVYLIGEVWDLSNRIAPYLRSLDSIFNFELADMLISCILYEGNCSSMLNSYVRITNNYTKESNKQIIDSIFLSNHDQNRVMSVFDNDLLKAKIAAALLLTLPGLPFIYYGEEIGMLGMTPHDKYRREPFLWSSIDTQGQTTWLEPLYTKISNGCIPLDQQLNDPSSLINHYKKLIHIRCQSDILLYGTLKPVVTRIRSLCLFEREYKNKSVLVAHNVGSRIQQISLPEKYRRDKGKMIFSTQNENHIMINERLNLEGYSSVMIECNETE
jgi:alpha-amylase